MTHLSGLAPAVFGWYFNGRERLLYIRVCLKAGTPQSTVFIINDPPVSH